MKFKLKVQKVLQVGGLLAAAYAGATCYQQTSSLFCLASGTLVDETTEASPNGYWHDGFQPFQVKATSDWYFEYAPNFVYYPAPGVGYTGHTPSGTPVTYCHGGASFKDYAGNTVTVTDWQEGSINGQITFYIWTNSTGTGTCP